MSPAHLPTEAHHPSDRPAPSADRSVLFRVVLGILCHLFSSATARAQAEDRAIAFRDVAAERGLDFVHVSPFTPQRHLHLTMGSGLGWLDYDRDGCPDLYLAQGCAWTGSRQPASEGPADCLYRNIDGVFRPLSGVGIDNRAYGMGVAVGDFDNDGFPDLYVSCFGPNLLLHNNGDGTFSEQPQHRNLKENDYSASCTWIDADADGDLDLFVTNYVAIDDDDYKTCRQEGPDGDVAIACPPERYGGQRDRFYVNDGRSGFTEESASAGFHVSRPLHGLGVVAADLDGDGLTDLFVANDATPNELWINQGNGRFDEQGLISGTALNREGKHEAGMGVAASDVDQDGLLDLFLTHYFQETNTLYKNLGQGLFLDITNEIGMAAPSRTRLGFGTLMQDFDGDGFPDCFIANGHIHDLLPQLGRDVPYAQQPQLLWNDRGRRFHDVSQTCGDYFRDVHVGRGAASADFDGDGRLDIAVQHLGGAVSLLRNESVVTSKPIQCHLIGRQSARDPVGAVARLDLKNRTLHLAVDGSSSYLSCNDRPLHFFVADEESINSIEVTWVGGLTERWVNPTPRLGRLWLVQGTGEIVQSR